MNYDKTINEKRPIVNGSINPSLTLDEMLQFDLETKKTFIHYTQVAGQFNHHFSGVDKEVFTPLEDLYDHTKCIQVISEPDADIALTRLYNRMQAHQLKMQVTTYARQYELGQKIYKAQQDLEFSGELNLSIGQLCGYNKAVGQWNDFYPDEINKVLVHLDKIAPRKDCGINNPNTGRTEYTWIAKSDYIYMHVCYAHQKTVDVWNHWFKTVAVHQQRALKADSMRISIDDLGDPPTWADRAFSITVVIWWD